MQKNNNRPVLIMAGGTGGHVYPALAVARALRERNIPVVWLGTRQGLEARVVPAAGFTVEWLPIAGVRGKNIFRKVCAPFQLIYAVLCALGIFLRLKPRLALGLGGFVAAPGGLAAYVLKVPLAIHEQNAVAGLTNRMLSRVADSVMQAFPQAFSAVYMPLYTGNPVRRDIAELPHPAVRLQGRTGPLRVLILGGSQGATFLNRAMPEAIRSMPPDIRPLLRHQCGRDHVAATENLYQEAGVEAQVSAFIEDMAEAYAWADIAICRAGAMTIAELTAVGLGAILTPFPAAVDDHQAVNASFMVDNGAALLASQAQWTPALIGDWLSEMLIDRGRTRDMANKARALAKPDATETVIHECLELIDSRLMDTL
ncbi:MAG: undecaprenyldiphospho-muramoylpentapeptide beta-N-acetylglucosaminyltransferase [Gammaproteobacteria bacterium]|nr:undecaprenyldiphospho-muramoylpentapeptide beta-N-acetylglucosaminyltransferase [Gammaproteobacteria bacterium]